MTYSKAMAAIKSYPYPIRSVDEAKGILAVGEKIANQCGEYIKTGKIFAAGQYCFDCQRTKLKSSMHVEKVKNTPRQNALLEFTKIHGVGSKTAKDLYDNHGCRTIDDIRRVRLALPKMLPSMGDNSIDRKKSSISAHLSVC
jgi:DNA polymerase/3'-5' exonuclease PolX